MQANGGSVTSSLRQWRKKDYVEKKSPEENSPSGNENPSHIARVAPHTYYPRPPEDPYNYQHSYGEYSQPYKPPAPVKYSEIVENQQPQTIEQITPVLQKHKEKDYADICGGPPPQSHLKQFQDHISVKQSAYPDPPLPHQYIPKDSQIHPFLQKQQMQQYLQKESYQKFLQYNMQSQYSQPYSSEPNNFLAHLNKINPRMAQSIINDTHLRETQIPMYHGLEQNRPYPQPQRMYHAPSMSTNPNHSQRNYNYPQPYNYSKSSDPYSRPYQHNVSKYLPDYKINDQSNISPRLYNDNVHLNYDPFPPKMSPNYSQLEYAQHYQHRRQFPQDYFTHPAYKGPFAQNPQMSPEDMGMEGGPIKSSLKQYLESWVEENISGNLTDIIPPPPPPPLPPPPPPPKTTSCKSAGGDSQDQPLYVLDSTDIPNDNLPHFLHLQQIEKLPDNIQGYYQSGSAIQSENRRVIVENNNQEGFPNDNQPSGSTIPDVFTGGGCSMVATVETDRITEASNREEHLGKGLENKVVQIHIVENSQEDVSSEATEHTMSSCKHIDKDDSVIKMCPSRVVSEEDGSNSNDSDKSMPDIDESPKETVVQPSQDTDGSCSEREGEDDLEHECNNELPIFSEATPTSQKALEANEGEESESLMSPYTDVDNCDTKCKENVTFQEPSLNNDIPKMDDDTTETLTEEDEIANVEDGAGATETVVEWDHQELRQSTEHSNVATVGCLDALLDDIAFDGKAENENCELLGEFQSSRTEADADSQDNCRIEKDPASNENLEEVADSHCAGANQNLEESAENHCAGLNRNLKEVADSHCADANKTLEEVRDSPCADANQNLEEVAENHCAGVNRNLKEVADSHCADANQKLEEVAESHCAGGNRKVAESHCPGANLQKKRKTDGGECSQKKQKSKMKQFKNKTKDDLKRRKVKGHVRKVDERTNAALDKSDEQVHLEAAVAADDLPVENSICVEHVLPPLPQGSAEDVSMPVLEKATFEENEANVVYHINDSNVVLQIGDELLEINVTVQNGKKLIMVKTFSDAVIMNNAEESSCPVLEDQTVAQEKPQSPPPSPPPIVENDVDMASLELSVKEICEGPDIPIEDDVVLVFNEEVVSSSTTEIEAVQKAPEVVEVAEKLDHASEDKKNAQEKRSVKKKSVSWSDQVEPATKTKKCLENVQKHPKTKAALKFVENLNQTKVKDHCVPSSNKTIAKPKKPSENSINLKIAKFRKLHRTSAAEDINNKTKCDGTEHKHNKKTESLVPKIVADLTTKAREKPIKKPPTKRSADPRKSKNKQLHPPKSKINIDMLYKMSIEPENLPKIKLGGLNETTKTDCAKSEETTHLISVQENSITSSTCQESSDALQKQRAKTLIQQINDDWEDDFDSGMKVVDTNKRRLSLQEYNSRRHAPSNDEPVKSDLTSDLPLDVGNVKRASPELTVKFINRTYSRSEKTATPPCDDKKESLSGSIELQLPKRDRIFPTPTYNQDYLRNALMNDLHTVNQITTTLIKENQELMHRFLEQQRLTTSELKKVKQIIRYKRLVQHLTTMKLKESESYGVAAAETSKSIPQESPQINRLVEENPQVSLKKNKRKRFRFLYSDDETTDFNDMPKCSPVNDDELKLDKSCCVSKRPRVDNVNTTVPTVDYSVHQRNSQGQLTLVFKRSFKNDPKMQPFVKLERSPSLDWLACNL